MSENFPEFRLTDYTTPEEQSLKGGTRKFVMFNGPNIKIYSFFLMTHKTSDLWWNILRDIESFQSVCVLVDRDVCVWVHSLDSWAAFVIVRVLRFVSVFKKN